MTQKPIVSVVMATYNEPPTIIAKAINSITRQTLQNIEIIIIDDSTNPTTISTIDQLAEQDSRITIIRQPTKIGFVPALNIGLETAKGQYISRMDGDDMAIENKLETQIKFLENNPNVAVVGSSMNIIDQNDNISSQRNYPTTHNKILKYAIFRSPFAHPTVVFRREIVDQGFRYDPKLTRCEDVDLWLKLINAGYIFANCPEKLLNYRVVGDLALKRKDDHWKTNRMVRWRNFSWKKPVYDTLAVIIACIHPMVPRKIISYIYKKENK